MPKKPAVDPAPAGGKSSAKKSIAKTGDGTKKASVSASSRANLVFPIPRVMGLMKKDRLNKRVGKSGAIMMTGLLECITSKILLAASDAADDAKKKTIKADHVRRAIEDDDQFAELLSKITIHKGDSKPIHK